MSNQNFTKASTRNAQRDKYLSNLKKRVSTEIKKLLKEGHIKRTKYLLRSIFYLTHDFSCILTLQIMCTQKNQNTII